MTKKQDYELGDEIRAWSVCIPDNAIIEVTNTLKSKWINTGKKEKEFRNKIANRFNSKYVTATTSGTMALKIALKSIGVGPGDEVVSTPYTFMATNTAILEEGAKPVFADIDYATLNIAPSSISEKITNKTKAIIGVHYAGNPFDLDEVNNIAKDHNIPVIEDSCHALGSEYKDKSIGNTNNIACFSFQCVKIVTCGDAGILCTNNEEYYIKNQRISWYGMDRDIKKTDILDPLPHSPIGLGLKGNLNDIIASLGCAAMDHIDIALEQRKAIGEKYRRNLCNLNKVTLIDYKMDRKPNYQIFPIHVEQRENFAKFMWNKGIQVNVNNRRNDVYDIFGGMCNDLKELKQADEDVILLPIHSDLRDVHIERIIDATIEYDKL